MRYVIYGAGGIGGGMGAQLFQAGREVVLIARGAHLERIRERGLTLHTPEAKVTLPIAAVGHPEEIDFRSNDVVVFAMKSQDTHQALVDLRLACGSEVPVIMAQNGVANERMACRRFRRVYAMLVFVPATYLEPGLVLLNGMPTRGVLDAGCFPAGIDSLIETVCADLQRANFLSRPDPRIQRLKYGKLLLNLGNAVQALCGVEARMRDLIHLLRQEAVACLQAAGIDYVTPKELYDLRAGDFEVAEIDGRHRGGGSTWQSFVRGQRLIEADYLNGEVVLLGTLHGVPTPRNRLVLELAVEAAKTGQAPGSLTVEEIQARFDAVDTPPSGS